MGYVYLFLEIDSAGQETYKIGITKNDPNKRIKQLQILPCKPQKWSDYHNPRERLNLLHLNLPS